jgi:hypothetical protein
MNKHINKKPFYLSQSLYGGLRFKQDETTQRC